MKVMQNAVVRGTLLGLQYMGKDEGGNGGVVVNIASILGLAPLAGSPVYVATKHAVIGHTRSLEYVMRVAMWVFYSGVEWLLFVVFLFGVNFPEPEFYMPTFRNALYVLSS